jgi:hypothetical protein
VVTDGVVITGQAELVVRELEPHVVPGLAQVPDAPVRPGTPVQFTLTYNNDGYEVAESTTIEYEVPTNMEISGATPPWDDVQGNRLIWRVGRLGVGEGSTIALQGRVGGAAAPGSVLRNRVVAKYYFDGQLKPPEQRDYMTRIAEATVKVEIAIFNSAGEKVYFFSELPNTYDVVKPEDLQVEQYVNDEGLVEIRISYFGQIYYWQAVSQNGAPVDNGSYNVQVLSKQDGKVIPATNMVVVNQGPMQGLARTVVPAPNPATRGQDMVFAVEPMPEVDYMEIRIKVFTLGGRLVASLPLVTWERADPQNPAWNLTNEVGGKVGPGLYFAQIDIRNGDRSDRQRVKFLVR